MLAGSIGYTSALTDYAIETTAQADIVQEQLADPDTDVFNGLPFATGDETEPTDQEKMDAIAEYLQTLDTAGKAARLYFRRSPTQPGLCGPSGGAADGRPHPGGY